MKSYVLFSLWLMFSYFLNEAAGVAMRHDVLDPMFLTWATLPGTIMHEGSHYIMSLLLGGHPVSFNVVPRAFYVDGELAAILQGSVLFKINEYNGAASALAPLLLVPVPAFFYLALNEGRQSAAENGISVLCCLCVECFHAVKHRF